MMTPALRTDRFNTLTFFKFSTSSRWCSCISLKLYLEFQTLKAKIAAREAKRNNAIPSYDVTSTAHKNQSRFVSVVNELASEMPLPHNKTVLVKTYLHISLLLNSDNSHYSVKLTNIREIPQNESSRARSEIDKILYPSSHQIYGN